VTPPSLCYIACGPERGTMARKPTDMVQLKLRFSEALRRRLEREAARNNRSMNTEIIHRLEESFRQHEINQSVLDGIRSARNWAVVGGDEAAMRLAALEEELRQLGLWVRAAIRKTEDDGEKR
jgi:hypothetical protein